MKHIILLGDGMADEPIDSLGKRTPLQAAHTPNMDRIARLGRTGLLSTVPQGFTPGSEIANLSVLGYDLRKVFEGRGSLEAASMGVEIAPGEMVMRCNLITVEEGNIKNHSAGHISSREAAELIQYLNEELAKRPELKQGFDVKFFPGVSYRHLLKVRDGNKQLECTPPHDVPGEPVARHLIRAKEKAARPTADMLNSLIVWSQEALENHPLNRKRVEAGKQPANSIWPWSPGYRPQMETLQQRYGIRSGSVISAVDLIKGIGVYAGLTPVRVLGATGLFDTNYKGKAEAAIAALEKEDFVFLHVEAADEAGHEGDVALKVRTIEDFDRMVVGPVLDWVLACNVLTANNSEAVSIALLPDHPTPCRLRTHTSAPVPVAIYNPRVRPDEVSGYDEFSVRKGSLGHVAEGGLMDIFMGKIKK